MPRITIGDRTVDVPRGSTILQAARLAGLEIPTLCHLEGFEGGASCMVCAVRLRHSGQFIPSCASRVVDGMEVESASEPVREARRMALELLFSDHLGDCLSPCQRICPAQLGIPAVLEHLRNDEPGKAAAHIRRDLALAGVLCRVCHRPCESGCRRGVHDEPVAIAGLVRHAIDAELHAGPPRLPPLPPERGARVAIVGAGFTGLSAAWFLAQRGYRTEIFERSESPGHSVREAFPELPAGLLDAELDLLERAGLEFHGGTTVADAEALGSLAGEFAAVLLATGADSANQAEALGLEVSGKGLRADRDTMMTSIPGVFAAGRAVRPAARPVNCVADAKAVAACIHQHLTGNPVHRPPKPFSVFMGRLIEGEMEQFLTESDPCGRSVEVDIDHAIAESKRCVRCHCAKADTCRLRQLAIDYRVDPNRFNSGERLRYSRNVEHPLVRFEPAKCIRCGNCIQVAADHAEPLGLTFIGRGFDVHLGVPFHGPLSEALHEAAHEAVAACPTGALTLRDEAAEPS